MASGMTRSESFLKPIEYTFLLSIVLEIALASLGFFPLAIRISSTALSCFLNSREQPLRKRVKRRKSNSDFIYCLPQKKEMTERTLINDNIV
jgi:hypothetical protein